MVSATESRPVPEEFPLSPLLLLHLLHLAGCCGKFATLCVAGAWALPELDVFVVVEEVEYPATGPGETVRI